jgi:hypothetical protein
MTCFWDSILSSLKVDDFTYINTNISNIKDLIKLLKTKNQLIENVLWQNKELTKQEKEEHYEAIECYNISEINGGHLTSICDSFLLLICDIFYINIEHLYINYEIAYKNKKKTRKTLRFRSNNGHFQIN